MPDKTPDENQTNAVAAECQSCGHRFRLNQWGENVQCPECRANRVQPLVAPGGAVDYLTADRSEGYAPADVRFAQWAKWTGLITPNQHEIAFVKQNRQIQRGSDPDPIHEIMVNENWIAREQAEGLLEFMAFHRPCEDDEEFAELIKNRTDADEEKVDRTRKLQAGIASSRNEVPPLCQLLMEKRVITEAQMLGALKHLQKQGRGPLEKARRMAGERKSTRRVQAVKKKISLKNPVIRNILIVLLLLLLGVGAWQIHASRGPKAAVKCRECDEVSWVSWSQSYPVKCPSCGSKSAYYAMKCKNEHIFTISNPYQRRKKCPVCDTTRVRPLKEGDLEEENP